MSFFDCTICGNSHKLITLLEFPQPDIISKITSGQVDSSLKIFAKNNFVINKETIVVQSLLSLPIIDFEDEFDLLVWVEISGHEYLSCLEKLRKVNYSKANAEAKLIDPIPFFSGTNNLLLKVEVDADNEDGVFSIIEINENINLKKYLKNGISKKELAVILSPLYH